MSEYKVIYGESTKDLTEEVNKLLAEDWKCQGGVCVTAFSYIQEYNNERVEIESFYQALVKEDK